MSSRYDNSRVKGMLHARGRKIVNGDGEEIILRGWGAGNWTNPEGFMVGIGEKYMGSCMSPELALPGLALAAVVPAGWAVWDVFAQPPQPLEPEQLLEPVPVVDWAAVAAQSV